MDIGASMSTARNVGAATAEERAAVEKEGFLKLLVAQLSNQDPMQPQDADKYVQQLTNFSNLEQLMNLNKGVEQLSIGQLSNNTQEAIRFVGRDVVAKGNTLHWDESGISPVRYNLQDEAETVTATVYDSNGSIVRTAQLPTRAGKGQFEWDGRDDEGRQLEPGEYTVSIEAVNAKDVMAVDTYFGRVDGLRYDNGYRSLLSTADAYA